MSREDGEGAQAGLTDLQRLRAEFLEFLPMLELLPDLSPAEVSRFAELGQLGRERFRAGHGAGAEAAFRAQISVFPANHEPWFYLALIEASRGSEDAAMDDLHQAVIRGFADLHGIQRAEAWSKMRRNTNRLLDLADAIPILQETERDWPAWGAVAPIGEAPQGLAGVLSDQARFDARIAALAPALGPRLTRLWERIVARATAARLEAYVTARPQAEDHDQALDRLLRLYADGPMDRWTRLPAAVASRVAEISKRDLARGPHTGTRPAALLAGALAHNARRNEAGRLDPAAAEEIRQRLGELLERHADSPLVVPALVGLVRTETEAGRFEAAAGQYRKFLERHTGNDEILGRARQELGELALRMGGLPRFKATALDGRSVEPAQLAGNVVVFDFWATWCGPCVEGLSALRRMGQRHGANLTLVGVNLDAADEISDAALREWIARAKMPGAQVHDGRSWDSELVRAFGVKEIPFTVVVGPDGAVLAVNEHGKRLEKTVGAAVRRATQTAAARADP